MLFINILPFCLYLVLEFNTFVLTVPSRVRAHQTVHRWESKHTCDTCIGHSLGLFLVLLVKS